MNMKKWSAGVMAAAMAFSLALPAGAAADPEAIQPLAYYDERIHRAMQDIPSHTRRHAGLYYELSLLYGQQQGLSCGW